jgi:uncharacterized protein
MPYFAILGEDKPDSLDLRMATRPVHVEYLKSLGPALKIAGPFMTEDEYLNGTLVVVEAADLAAAQAIAAGDPYAKVGLFASSTVKPWRLGLGGFLAE